MRITIALGGNALLRPELGASFDEYLATIRNTCRMLADLVQAGHEITLTHGNASQVGNLLIQQERARGEAPPMPLDVLGAETQGQIGYLLQQSLTNELRGRAIDVPVITVITRVLVDAQDASFAHPTKPIGPFYPAPLVETLKNGYKFVQIRGRWRRVVPSPEPRQIVEGGQIKRLVEGGAIVIACGGGGIPVIWERGRLRGVEAVIDKDLTAQLLATLIGANLLLNLTAVDGVYLNWGTERQRKLDRLSIKEAKTYLSEGQFPPGSMGPKVEAAVRFIEGGGERAIIAALEDAARAVEGKAGTCIER